MAGAVRKALSGDGFAAAFCAISVALALAFAFPQPAFAGIAEDINAWLCGILRDTCNWIFAGQADMLRSIGADGVLAADFAQMLGSAGDVTMYDLVRGVWQAAILPIGCGMLSLVFTVQPHQGLPGAWTATRACPASRRSCSCSCSSRSSCS